MGFFQHLHARFPHPIQRARQVRDAERDVIDDMAARADQRAGALARVDYQTDLAEPNRRRRRTNHAERLAGRGEGDFAGAAALRATARAEMFDIPLGGAEWRVAVRMYMNEGAGVRCVDLDQRAVRRFHISEEQPRPESGYPRL